LKNRNFNKAGTPDLQQRSGAEAGHVQDTWSMEAAAKMEMPAKLKTDSLNCLGILFDELIQAQRVKLLDCARRIIPHITPDDLLQPNDFPELELHPHFRYEEGILEGLLTARMAFLAWQRDQQESTRFSKN